MESLDFGYLTVFGASLVENTMTFLEHSICEKTELSEVKHNLTKNRTNDP